MKKTSDFHGMKCLTGRFIEDGWVKNKVCHIPLDKISSIIEFSSLADFRKAERAAEAE